MQISFLFSSLDVCYGFNDTFHVKLDEFLFIFDGTNFRDL